MFGTPAMRFALKIEAAFENRKLPNFTTEQAAFTTPEQRDAMWFHGRDWRDLTRTDWEGRSDAFYSFSPEAFVYYLPSILKISSERPEEPFPPADSMLCILDRSPVVDNWDEFLISRMSRLTFSEYATISEWLIRLLENNFPYDQAGISRAFDTIQLLDQASRTVAAQKQ
jgi:hypothetical protein